MGVVAAGGARACGSTNHHPTTSFLLTALLALAQRAQVLQGVNAGVVPVAPDDLVGVAAHARHADGGQGGQFVGLEDAEGVRRLLALLAAAGTRAVGAQVLPGVHAVVPVAPVDEETVAPFLSERNRQQRLRAGRGHGDDLRGLTTPLIIEKAGGRARRKGRKRSLPPAGG